jgi:hypothetical protein
MDEWMYLGNNAYQQRLRGQSDLKCVFALAVCVISLPVFSLTPDSFERQGIFAEPRHRSGCAAALINHVL